MGWGVEGEWVFAKDMSVGMGRACSLRKHFPK